MKTFPRAMQTLGFAHLLGVRPPKGSAPTPPPASAGAAHKGGRGAAAAAPGPVKAAPDRDRQHLVQAAVRAHRDRCAQILAAGITLGLVRKASSLAFDTALPAHVAIAKLKAAAKDHRQAHPNPPSSTEPSGNVKSLVQQILAAGAMARGEA